jgi:hypothetical protein
MDHHARLAGSSWIRRDGETVQVHELLPTCDSGSTFGPGTALVMVRNERQNDIVEVSVYKLRNGAKRRHVT